MANSLISQTVKTGSVSGKVLIPTGTVAINSNRIKTIDAEGADDSKVFYRLRNDSGLKEYLCTFIVDDAPAVLVPKISLVGRKHVSWSDVTDSSNVLTRYFPVDDIIMALVNNSNSSYTDIYMEAGTMVVVRTVNRTLANVVTDTTD